MSASNELPRAVNASWHAFLETYEPLRPDLYRYCRHLTRSPWDAEDLAQDTLARAFVTLGRMGDAPPSARAWLFRVASNLWIDRVRRARREAEIPEDHDEATATLDPRATREAAGTLLGQLSPQERAAVVLKDAFDLSLDEVAEALTTTVGAVKAALSRARTKLDEPTAERPVPAPPVLDAFCRAFNAGDLDALTELLLENGCVEVNGATTQYGREAARRTVLWGMLFGVQRMVAAAAGGDHVFEPGLFRGALGDAPRVEARWHRDGWIILHWYAHEEGDLVRAVTRIEADGDAIARLENHFYDPELIAEVCAELGVPWRTNGYRWWPKNPR